MRGKARLARAALRPWRRCADLVVRDRDGSVFTIPSLEEPIGLHLAADGVYEPELASFLRDHLRPGGVFVDVGANIGVFTVMAARMVGPSGRVVAIEASPRVYPYLEHNVRTNGLENVRLRHCAAAHEENPGIAFYEAPASHFGMGALSPQFHATPTPVASHTLDRILAEENVGPVDLVKLDVEGFEANVFRGAHRLLTSDSPPLIVFEFVDWAEARVATGRVGDSQRVLREHGFTLWRLEDYVKNKPPLQEILTEGFGMIVAARNVP
jgi:FkbM family methyltransferase